MIDTLVTNGQFRFLKTLTGDQANQKTGRSTYCREYRPFGGSDDMRKKISIAMHNSICEGAKVCGEHYAFMEGVVFGTLKKLDDSEKYISSLAYAALRFKPQLEKISGLKIEELIKQFDAYGHNYLTHYFFEPVEFPQEGDLVVYAESSHCGIYREGLLGGSLESKWDFFESPYVFQHDLFFIPPSFGNVAQFYRVKTESIKIDTLAIKEDLRPEENVLSGTTVTFKTTEENLKRRHIVDTHSGKALSEKLPEIQHLSYIKFFGVCYNYAFGRILSTYRINANMPNPEGHGQQILDKYFASTSLPQKGDLVVYYNGSDIKHWGVYIEDGIVESKWGSGAVYRHPFFDAPSQYGDTVRCFKLKPGLTISSVLAQLAND